MKKFALITGAGGGIGRGLSIALAHRGYHLILVGRNATNLETTSHEVDAFSSASIYCTDLAGAQARSRLVESVISQFGVPDLLVNNAASMPHGAFMERTITEIETTIFTNLVAPAELTNLFFAGSTSGQSEQSCGVIFVLSTAARFPQPYNSLYSASKAGLRYLAESLQVELVGKIRICLAYPPVTATPMTENFDLDGWSIRKADAMQVAECIIARFEAGENEISWFDWEAVLGFLYRFAPGLFRKALNGQRKKLLEMSK